MTDGNQPKLDPTLEHSWKKLLLLIQDFEQELHSGELRQKVLSLVPIMQGLRRVGKSLVPKNVALSARDRILYYFQRYPQTVIQGDELLVVSGIQEYARRVRELRVQFGWAIASGVTIKEMLESNFDEIPGEYHSMKPSEYVLLRLEQDRDAAHRWNIANTIRKQGGSTRDRILKYLRANVGVPVTNEELRYVAGNSMEWARRSRELRTEFGWPISTKNAGRPDLAIGEYLLEADRQSPEHDRRIPDDVRGAVMRRDGYKCTKCGWSHDIWNRSDPRHLELHHVKPHARGGDNELHNLITLCTICHDKVHRK